jgi:sec-independent protein translocase protein TatA
MFSLPGATEWLVIAIVGLLIFGKRLPEVARNLGRTVVEFKKGIRDMQEEVRTSTNTPPPPRQIAPADVVERLPETPAVETTEAHQN